MTILALLILLLVLGFFAWLTMRLPEANPFRLMIVGVLVVVGGIAILQAFGVLDVLRQQVPHL
jgi:uncharacterized membrane protein YdcZ (DUF606 family)